MPVGSTSAQILECFWCVYAECLVQHICIVPGCNDRGSGQGECRYGLQLQRNRSLGAFCPRGFSNSLELCQAGIPGAAALAYADIVYSWSRIGVIFFLCIFGKWLVPADFYCGRLQQQGHHTQQMPIWSSAHVCAKNETVGENINTDAPRQFRFRCECEP